MYLDYGHFRQFLIFNMWDRLYILCGSHNLCIIIITIEVQTLASKFFIIKSLN